MARSFLSGTFSVRRASSLSRASAWAPLRLSSARSSASFRGFPCNDMNPVRKPKVFYTYVLQSLKSGYFYTGYTNNLRKRFKEHTEERSSYTKGRGPYTLVYYEVCFNEGDARSRELYLKSGKGKRYLKSRLKRFLFRTG